jgi:hypothetical protein
LKLRAEHWSLQTLKRVRQYIDIIEQARFQVAIGFGQKKHAFVMLAYLRVDGFQQGVHIFEMAKKRPQAHTSFFGDLLGRRCQIAIVEQGQCRRDNRGAAAGAALAATVNAFYLSFFIHYHVPS